MSNAIFEEIASRCSISDALSITGLSLKNSGGREVAPPQGVAAIAVRSVKIQTLHSVCFAISRISTGALRITRQVTQAT